MSTRFVFGSGLAAILHLLLLATACGPVSVVASRACVFTDSMQGKPSGCVGVVDPGVNGDSMHFSFSPDGQTIAVVAPPPSGHGKDANGSLVVYDLGGRRVARKMDLPGDWTGEFVDGEVRYGNQFWNVATGELTGTLPKLTPDGSYTDYQPLPGKRVMVYSHGGMAVILDRDTGDVLERVRDYGPTKHYEFAFSEDGSLVAVGDCESIGFYALSPGRPSPPPLPYSFLFSKTVRVVLSRDGRFLAMACKAGQDPFLKVGVWETTTGREVGVMNVTADIAELAVSPDGSIFSVATYDKRMRVYSLEPKQELQNLAWARNPLDKYTYARSLTFSPDGRYLLVGWENEPATLFDVNTWRGAAGLPIVNATMPTATPWPLRTPGPSPTFEPTVTPTITPDPTAVFEDVQNRLAVAQKWPVVFSDNFDSNVNQWPLREASFVPARAAIQGGVYRWTAHPDSSSFLWEPPGQRIKSADVYVSLDARRLAGPTDEGYGLVFRESSRHNSFYAFRINDAGRYQFMVLVPGSLVWDLIEWTPASAIRPGEWNKLAVLAEGPQISLFINDQYIRTVVDEDLSSGGIGVTFDVEENQDNIFEFDNVEARAP